jgi:hypothetical protein
MNEFATSPQFSTSRALRALAFVVSLVIAPIPATAKRALPKPVPAVVSNSVEYSAPREHMGFVVATDNRSRKELWRKRIYSVRTDHTLERDVQDIFITSLAIERRTLIITNERGDSYTLELATQTVTKRK